MFKINPKEYVSKPSIGNDLLKLIETRLNKPEPEKETSVTMNDNNFLGMYGKEELNLLVRNRNIYSFNKKQLIFQEGKRPVNVFYIQKGKVRTSVRNNDGKELVVGLFNQGDFIGYTALLDGGCYEENAETLEETEVAVIPKKDFEDLLFNNEEVTRFFFRLLTKDIVSKNHHLLSMAYDSLRRKVAVALLQLRAKFHARDDLKFQINISRQTLSSIAGTATESLIRTLSDFKNESIIETDMSGNIRISNEQKLEHIVY
jgi:CRP/FNR family transcriptional regulator, cyclic AMP receptor protein